MDNIPADTDNIPADRDNIPADTQCSMNSTRKQTGSETEKSKSYPSNSEALFSL